MWSLDCTFLLLLRRGHLVLARFDDFPNAHLQCHGVFTLCFGTNVFFTNSVEFLSSQLGSAVFAKNLVADATAREQPKISRWNFIYLMLSLSRLNIEVSCSKDEVGLIVVETSVHCIDIDQCRCGFIAFPYIQDVERQSGGEIKHFPFTRSWVFEFLTRSFGIELCFYDDIRLVKSAFDRYARTYMSKARYGENLAQKQREYPKTTLTLRSAKEARSLHYRD